MKMLTKLKSLGAPAAALAALAAIFVLPASAQADPSPYCRPSVGTPTGTERYVGSSQYTVTVTVTVKMTCNGAIYAGSAVAVLEYTRDSGTHHIVTSSGCSSAGKSGCTVSKSIVFTAHCDDYIFVTAFGRQTGYWQQTSSSAKNNISTGKGGTLDDFWTGETVC